MNKPVDIYLSPDKINNIASEYIYHLTSNTACAKAANIAARHAVKQVIEWLEVRSWDARIYLGDDRCLGECLGLEVADWQALKELVKE